MHCVSQALPAWYAASLRDSCSTESNYMCYSKPQSCREQREGKHLLPASQDENMECSKLCKLK